MLPSSPFVKKATCVYQSFVIYTVWESHPTGIQNFSPTLILFRSDYSSILQRPGHQSVTVKAYLYCSLTHLQA